MISAQATSTRSRNRAIHAPSGAARPERNRTRKSSMKATEKLARVLMYRPVAYAGSAAVILAIIVAVIDWITWIELDESIVFSLPLLLVAAARNRRLLWGLTIALAITTFAVYAVQIPPGTFSWHEPFFIDRLLSFVVLISTAGVLHAWTLALDALEAQAGSLQRQNQELVRCREEITRQNEELDRARREAEAASGRKSELLASVSHDIRSPLSTINMTAEVIRRTIDDPTLAARLPGLTQRLQAGAQRLAELVTDVLDLSAIESGRIELHSSEFSLNELIAAEVLRLSTLAQAENLRLIAAPPDPPIRLVTDRIKLARVLANLVTNAIKFTERGSVTLSAVATPDDGIRISVRDTGIGIAPENLERIFDEYAQLRESNNGRKKGWGLGLAICQRLVRVMGGEITVESELGRGSIFTIRLPVACVAERAMELAPAGGSRP